MEDPVGEFARPIHPSAQSKDLLYYTNTGLKEIEERITAILSNVAQVKKGRRKVPILCVSAIGGQLELVAKIVKHLRKNIDIQLGAPHRDGGPG